MVHTRRAMSTWLRSVGLLVLAVAPGGLLVLAVFLVARRLAAVLRAGPGREALAPVPASAGREAGAHGREK